ncbi:aquaporin [Pyrenophora tritici-repentis]|nr:aquaporin [Pyrenophora tritici-repentis]KAI0584379.1 aquaporin [Pyrenophora tritici-repentis]KAI0610526.1 aquaporin [Pyrenophora tritici-repentis]KAI0622587.1 aquaporin [Pyrenophora tritici-repentis]KAI1574385.1 GlpF Glycerol uptake facilitator [Pyrenophora tritici-repentis]
MVLPGMKQKYTEDPQHPAEPRQPGCGWLPNRARHHLISFLGEYVGTFLFLFFAFAATQVANNLRGTRPMDVGTLLYISLAFGCSLAITVWVFFRISGGLFNPAVTFAMGLVGAIGWVKVLLLILAQTLGAITAAAIVSGLFPGPLSVNTSLSKGTSVTRGLFIEMFLTFMLLLTIFMLAAEKHRATFIAPLGIGLALFIAELAGVYFTGGSLNPARSFGPALITGKWPGHHWIYWLGPLLGAAMAAGFYRLLKTLGYETANPGADGDGREEYSTRASDRTPTRYQTGTMPLSTTDGTEEHDFVIQLQSGQIQPAKIHRQAMPALDGTTSTITDSIEKPMTPTPVHMHNLDGHRSDTINHPEDRPRAHHKRGSSQHEMASDSSYRHGPNAESGSSES